MKIAFHSNQLGLRGTEVGIYEYGRFNESLLDNTSYILIPAQAPRNAQAEAKFRKVFGDRLIFYDDLDKEIVDHGIEACLYIKDGSRSGYISPKAKSWVQGVFQIYQPHGDKYFYNSKWLGEKMNNTPYIPRIVTMPEPNKDLREILNIDHNTKVFGRYGGYNEFDIPFVQKAIFEIVKEKNNIKFIFMNTKPFYEHENIIYVEGTADVQNKSNFISICDAMIHARKEGESFGLSIAEFLFHNKPVFAWEGGIDLNHVTMVPKSCLYNIQNIKQKLTSDLPNENYKQCVDDFRPEVVMKRFKEILIDA